MSGVAIMEMVFHRNATAPPRSLNISPTRSVENLHRTKVLSLPTLNQQTSAVGSAAMSTNFRSSFNEICESGIKYTHSGRPAHVRYRESPDLPSLEQIHRLHKDKKRGPKIGPDGQTEKVGGIKIPVAPAFKSARKSDVRKIVGRLTKPTTASSGVMDEKSAKKLEKVETEKQVKDEQMSPRRGRSFLMSRERSFMSRERSFSSSREIESRDQIQRERDFKHLQKDTLMSRIRYEVTRLFAPDPYGVREHKWPW